MKRILSVGRIHKIFEAVNEALRDAGFTVVRSRSATYAKWLLRKDQHDMVLIGPGILTQERALLIDCATRTCPNARIAALNMQHDSNPVPLADAALSIDAGTGTIVHELRLALQQPKKLAPNLSAKLLCVCATQSAAVLRRKALEEEGYEVVSVTTLQELEATCRSNVFDLVVIGPAVGPRMKLSISDVLRKCRCYSPILELGRTLPEIANARAVTETNHYEWLLAIAQLLSEKVEQR